MTLLAPDASRVYLLDIDRQCSFQLMKGRSSRTVFSLATLLDLKFKSTNRRMDFGTVVSTTGKETRHRGWHLRVLTNEDSGNSSRTRAFRSLHPGQGRSKMYISSTATGLDEEGETGLKADTKAASNVNVPVL